MLIVFSRREKLNLKAATKPLIRRTGEENPSLSLWRYKTPLGLKSLAPSSGRHAYVILENLSLFNPFSISLYHFPFSHTDGEQLGNRIVWRLLLEAIAEDNKGNLFLYILAFRH